MIYLVVTTYCSLQIHFTCKALCDECFLISSALDGTKLSMFNGGVLNLCTLMTASC